MRRSSGYTGIVLGAIVLVGGILGGLARVVDRLRAGDEQGALLQGILIPVAVLIGVGIGVVGSSLMTRRVREARRRFRRELGDRGMGVLLSESRMRTGDAENDTSYFVTLVVDGEDLRVSRVGDEFVIPARDLVEFTWDAQQARLVVKTAQVEVSGVPVADAATGFGRNSPARVSATVAEMGERLRLPMP